jgi:hypothetical protein
MAVDEIHASRAFSLSHDVCLKFLKAGAKESNSLLRYVQLSQGL